MSKKPIKSNLFRFVTLRSPQTIENKEIGFVSFPEGGNVSSKALAAVEGLTTVAERKTALENAYKKDFTPMAGRSQIRTIHEHLYAFSSWLMRNKSYLSYQSIAANLLGANPLSLQDELIVWDNLFYQTIHRESIPVRERLIQLLIANKFLKAFITFRDSFSEQSAGEIVFTDENEKEFERRANASVIIPAEIIISAQQQLKKAVPKPSLEASNYMKAHLEVALAKDRIKQQEAALNELVQAEVVFQKKEKLRYDAALKTYDASVEKHKKNVASETQPLSDAKTGLQKKPKTHSELPKFEFEKGVELVKDKRTTFSVKTLELLNSDELKMYDTFSEVKAVLKNKVKKDYQLVYQKTPQDAKEVAIAGTKIAIDPMKGEQLYAFTGMAMPNLATGKSVLLMNLNVGYANASVVDSTYKLTKTDGTLVAEGNKVKMYANSGNLLNISFFTEGQNFQTGMRLFSGELTLSNGVKLQFNTALFVDASLVGEELGKSPSFEDLESVGSYSGIATKVLDNEREMNADVPTIDDGILYGVSQLGIADFRRVEQEVCCYVPGEVSHIENIMAHEYKERSTRNLTSIEQTTEKSSEKEVENLTDTSSTERNELHTETSSIVNSDNASSFGANASVSGEKFGITFSTGTNFNSSSSNSSSNANSEALNYAQEVTERALERVVQKISTKRTSRVLKEFEENNTHGFDNRKGDKHVTGVYRWVDKIYKNKLINYGKRLTYEFALPEPAKFFIKSYLKNHTEDKKTNTGLIVPKKPIHPSKLVFQVNNAGDLNENNYQSLAAEYGAEVPVFLEAEVKVNKSFKVNYRKTTGSGEQEGDSISDKITLPKGYVLDNYIISGGFFSHGAGDINGGEVYISVGGETHYTKGNKIFSFESDRYSLVSKGIKDSLGVSASTWDMFSISFNVEAKCLLTEEANQQWQNETYKAIIDAYNERLQEYNEFIVSQNIAEEPSEKKKELSAKVNRGIERRELKRIAIDLIAKAHGVEVSRDNYKEEDGSVDHRYVTRSLNFQKHAEVVKFFEQAFEWEIMAYTFYPYFYGADANWDANFEYNEVNDPIFQAFLQSGMARSVVPVRPGFEEAVNWYMKTGEIWNGQGMVTDTDNDLYVSVAEEMQTIEGEVEGTWETRVPTSLTVLQADSVALNEGGLPCNPDCGEGGMFDSVKTYPDGVDFDIVGQNNNVA